MSKSFSMKNFTETSFNRIKDKKLAEHEISMIYARKDKKPMNIEDIENIYGTLVNNLKTKKVYNKTKILVTIEDGMSKFRTIKGFSKKNLDLDEYIDYFDSKVKDTTKFENGVANLRITILKK